MLEIDWVTILWEIVNFTIISIALYFLVFKPIVKRSEARAKEKARLLEEMISDREAAATHLLEIEMRLNNLEKEIQTITDEAYEQSKSLQAELLAATHEEANHILQNSLLEARKEQFFDMRQHQVQLVDLILKIASQTLIQVTPPAVHSSLLEELTKKVWDLGKTDIHQVQTIRDSLSERTPTAKVTVAMPLTIDQERNLVRTFSALADSDVNIDLDVDKSLIAGVKVRIGDLILDNSLASQLDDISEKVTESLDQLDKNYNE